MDLAYCTIGVSLCYQLVYVDFIALTLLQRLFFHALHQILEMHRVSPLYKITHALPISEVMHDFLTIRASQYVPFQLPPDTILFQLAMHDLRACFELLDLYFGVTVGGLSIVLATTQMSELQVEILYLKELLAALYAQMQRSYGPLLHETDIACWLVTGRGRSAVQDGRNDDLGNAAICPSDGPKVNGEVDVLSRE